MKERGKDPDEKLVIAYDMKLKRPGCVLLQAVMGGTKGVADSFPAELWLTALTPDLKLYTLTRGQLKDAVDVTVRHAREQGGRARR